MSSTPLRCLGLLLFILCLLVLPPAVTGQATRSAADKASVVAPFIDEQTLIVGRIELAKIEPGATVKLLSQIAPEPDRAHLGLRHLPAKRQTLFPACREFTGDAVFAFRQSSHLKNPSFSLLKPFSLHIIYSAIELNIFGYSQIIVK